MIPTTFTNVWIVTEYIKFFISGYIFTKIVYNLLYIIIEKETIQQLYTFTTHKGIKCKFSQ